MARDPDVGTLWRGLRVQPRLTCIAGLGRKNVALDHEYSDDLQKGGVRHSRRHAVVVDGLTKNERNNCLVSAAPLFRNGGSQLKSGGTRLCRLLSAATAARVREAC